MTVTKIPQRRRVLDHLIDHGYITDLVARNYGIRRLASRMNELKNTGVNFMPVTRHDDSGVRFVQYMMSEGVRSYWRDVRTQVAIAQEQRRAA